MAHLLDRIKEQLEKEGLEARTATARTWLRAKVSALKPNAAKLKNSILEDAESSRKKPLTNDTMLGRMYFFFYDPKLKDSLPYYDRFPLVIPIERYSDGFLGLNLHYIHPKQRVILLNKLSVFLNNHEYDETTRFKRLRYDTLKAAKRIFEHTPCIKRYLYTHIKSRFLEISADEWDIAALIPYEMFIGASKSKVWSESRKKF